MLQSDTRGRSRFFGFTSLELSCRPSFICTPWYVCMYVCICDPQRLFCSLTQRNKQTECLHSCTEYIFLLVIFKMYLWTPALSLLIPHPRRRFALDQWNSSKSMAGCVRITRELAYVYPHACTWYKQNKDPPDKALIHGAPSGQKLNRVPLTPAGSKQLRLTED